MPPVECPAGDVFGAIIDSLDDQITLIDAAGNILYFNHAWRRFAADNGLSEEHAAITENYFEVCARAAAVGDGVAAEVLASMRNVVAGRAPAMSVEYPCHSPRVKRWFIVRMQPLARSARPLFVISHVEVTRRKLAEDESRRLAYEDPLTQLANRRRFDERLESEWQQRCRARLPLTLLMIDIDHFKAYNDAHGHPAGDRCLAIVGGVLRRFARRGADLVARLGGEEFAVLLCDTGEADAARVAEDIRAAVAALLPRGGEIESGITVSIGCTTAGPAWNGIAEELVARADRALYAAKSGGRDRVVIGHLVN
ncbi:MAG: diguanylate cyclase [Gammaproteobacteria bacterium]